MNLPNPDFEAARRGQLEAMMTNAVDAIITIDQQGLIDSANPAAERVFGYEVTDIIGKNISILMPSPYREEHDGYLANYLRSGIRKIIGIGREVIGKRKDGTTFPMHLAVSEVNIGDRRMFNGIVRDISDLKEAERRLSQLNEELEERVRQRTAQLRAAQAELIKKEKLATLGQISGGIAHEIRNPLNALKTSAFFLMNAKNPSKEKMQEHLERIDRQVTIIDNVVTALSDVARLPEPQLRKQSIDKCIKPVLQATSIPSNIEVELQVEPGIPDVWVDEHQIPIVFRNLVRNARDAMPHGGKLIIRISDADDRVAIEVIDDGQGISPEDLDQITEPLYSTKARGMGLGLAISLAILEKNKGKLNIQSELGKGSTFRVELQAARD